MEPLGALLGGSWGLLGASWPVLEAMQNETKMTCQKRSTSRPILGHSTTFIAPQKSGGSPPFSIMKSFVLHVMLGIDLSRPKRRPRGPKTPPRAPQEPPRGPQECPRRLQEGLKRPQEPVKRALQLQRCPGKMPCHRMQGGHAKRWRAGGGVPPKGQAMIGGS